MKSDNTEALTEYYNEMHDKLVQRFQKRSGGWHNAEDVVQEAFARALKYINSFDPEHKPMAAWFNSILNNAFKDFRKEERRQGMVAEEDQIIDDLDTIVFKSETVEALLNHIDEMPEPKKTVIRLFVIQGYTAEEILQQTELNIASVRKIVHEFYTDVRERWNVEPSDIV